MIVSFVDIGGFFYEIIHDMCDLIREGPQYLQEINRKNV